MAAENPSWGEDRIANELKLKLGIRVSPRRVQKYLVGGGCPGRTPDPSQGWLTFVHNHAQAMLASDFLVVVTARFRVLYVLVIMELVVGGGVAGFLSTFTAQTTSTCWVY